MALPAIIQEIVRLIGFGPAMDLVRAFGGREIRIPKTETTDTWEALVEVIGAGAARALAGGMGGDQIYIALCSKALRAERNRRMIKRYVELLREGHSGRGAVYVIVGEFAPISCRTVEGIVNSPLPEGVAEAGDLVLQGSLF